MGEDLLLLKLCDRRFIVADAAKYAKVSGQAKGKRVKSANAYVEVSAHSQEGVMAGGG